MTLEILFIFSLLILVAGAVYGNAEDYVDSVINMLLNGGDDEISQPSQNNAGEQPFFDNGIWKCGNCDVIDKTKNIYSEENNVDTNVIDEAIEVQVGLSVAGTQCVTIAAEKTSSVQSVAGSCAGDHVTLSVKAAAHFTVNAYSG